MNGFLLLVHKSLSAGALLDDFAEFLVLCLLFFVVTAGKLIILTSWFFSFAEVMCDR